MPSLWCDWKVIYRPETNFWENLTANCWSHQLISLIKGYSQSQLQLHTLSINCKLEEIAFSRVKTGHEIKSEFTKLAIHTCKDAPDVEPGYLIASKTILTLFTILKHKFLIIINFWKFCILNDLSYKVITSSSNYFWLSKKNSFTKFLIFGFMVALIIIQHRSINRPYILVSITSGNTEKDVLARYILS